MTRRLSAAFVATVGLWLRTRMHSAAAAPGSNEAGDALLPSVVWMAPTLAGGGYSSEAISYALELEKEYRSSSSRFALRQFAEQHNMNFIQGVPEAAMEVLQELMAVGGDRDPKRKWDVAICHSTPDVWHADGAFGWGRANPCPPPDARYAVGRTMYETDRLPEAWVPRINQMDEVWVPSAFAVDQFVRSGVDRAKIVVVPEAVDTSHFDPSIHEPLDRSAFARKGKGDNKDGSKDKNAKLFQFLSVFKWEKRKGWEVLLRAYFEEFSASDDVELLIKTSAFHSSSDFEDKIKEFTAGLSSAKMPLARHAVLGSDLPLRELPRLYRGADAFVLPSRGEGWGRPHVEAMSMALPVIATNWSGSTEFLSDCCALPLKIEGLSDVEDGLPGHQWAIPSVPHLRSLMRWVVENPAEAKLIGQRAREEMLTRFSPEAILQQHVLPQLKRLAKRTRRKKSNKKSSGGGEL